MFYKFVCKPLGDDMSPFGSSAKRAWMVPVAIAASSLIDNIGNNAAQNSANRANLEQQRMANESNEKIARETNEMSQAQFNTNLQWLQKQFYTQHQYDLETRAYNDPVNMAARYQAAGINPAFAMGNGSPAAVNTVGSVGAPAQSNFQTPHFEAGHVEPAHFDTSGIAESIGESTNVYYRNELTRKQTERQDIDNQIARVDAAFKAVEKMDELRERRVRIDGMLESSKLSESQRRKLQFESDMLDEQLDILRAQSDDLKKREKINNRYTEAQSDLIDEKIVTERLEQNLKNIEANWKPLLAQAQIRLSNAQSQHLLAQLPLIAEQIGREIQNGQIKSIEIAKKKLEFELRKQDSYTDFVKAGAKKEIAPFYTLVDLIGEMLLKNLKLK